MVGACTASCGTEPTEPARRPRWPAPRRARNIESLALAIPGRYWNRERASGIMAVDMQLSFLLGVPPPTME